VIPTQRDGIRVARWGLDAARDGWVALEDLVTNVLERYFWVVPLLTVGASAAFAARASMHLLEARYLPNEPPPARSAARPVLPSPPRPPRSKDATGILARNMFCSQCPPILGEDHGPARDESAGQEIKSTLPLQLVATVTATEPQWSFALLRDTQGREVQNARGQMVKIFPMARYVPGSEVVDHAAVVERIEDRRVYLKVADHLEYLEILGPKSQDKTLPRLATSGPPGPRGPDLQHGVRKVSDTRFEIDRRALDTVLADGNALARSARIVPSISPRDGRPDGFKLYAIRPDSLYGAIGLQNGDTLAALNGQALDSPGRAFELYAKLRTASSMQISILRRGNPMTLDYSIR
jgi:general secretion pathway protein C